MVADRPRSGSARTASIFSTVGYRSLTPCRLAPQAELEKLVGIIVCHYRRTLADRACRSRGNSTVARPPSVCRCRNRLLRRRPLQLHALSGRNQKAIAFHGL